jgi:hypothetical protein
VLVAAQIEVRAELDVPGETGRQARVFVVWAVCLAAAVVAAISQRPRVAPGDRGTSIEQQELRRSRWDRAKFAAVLGILLPAGLPWLLTHRRRRHGPHARGIVVDITDDGELRLWGRGYGQRVKLDGATVDERLADVYCGRLGAWRQRRLRVRGAQPAGGRFGEIELATPADDSDFDDELRLEGGEGDCVELGRSDFMRVREMVLELHGGDDDEGEAEQLAGASA